MVARAEFVDKYRRAQNLIENRHSDLLAYAADLVARLETESGILRLVRGLVIMTWLTGSRFYHYLCVSVCCSASERGLGHERLDALVFQSPEMANSGSITIAQAGEMAKVERSKGKSVGFMHGHYRLLTPGSLLGIVLAGGQSSRFGSNKAFASLADRAMDSLGLLPKI